MRDYCPSPGSSRTCRLIAQLIMCPAWRLNRVPQASTPTLTGWSSCLHQIEPRTRMFPMHAKQNAWPFRTLLLISACVLCQVGWTQDPDQNVGGNRPMTVEQIDPNAQPLRQRTLPATRPSDEATQPATEPQSSLSEAGLQTSPASGEVVPSSSEPRRLPNQLPGPFPCSVARREPISQDQAILIKHKPRSLLAKTGLIGVPRRNQCQRANRRVQARVVTKIRCCGSASRLGSH